MNELTVPDEVKQSAERRARGATAGILEQLAQRMGGTAVVTAVYGAPIERGGVTVIPVARGAWGFGGGGGGSGAGPQGDGGGEGGGGGGGASPIGFIEIRDGRAEFQPITMRPPLWSIALVIFAVGLATAFVLHGVRRIVRR